MTVTFNVQHLAGDRAVVTGEDTQGTKGSTVVDASEYNEMKLADKFELAEEAFDRVVAETFAPITEAMEHLEAVQAPTLDPRFYVVEQEHEEGQAAQAQVVRKLEHDTVVLRLIEAGTFDDLIWVDGELEILAL